MNVINMTIKIKKWIIFIRIYLFVYKNVMFIL